MAAAEPKSAGRDKTVLLRIGGRVQGVGYRMWAVTTARSYGLAGWVRNLTDGSVEALAQGRPDAVDAFVADCREGPAWANVQSVEVSPNVEPFSGSGFEQRPTAAPAG